jgi:hypothetical protein
VELDDVAVVMAVAHYQQEHPALGPRLRISPDPELTAQDVASMLDHLRDQFPHLVLVESGTL